MNDSSPMPFGIHGGKKLVNVPADYLLWLHKNEKCGTELRSYIGDNMEVLKMELTRQGTKRWKKRDATIPAIHRNR